MMMVLRKLKLIKYKRGNKNSPFFVTFCSVIRITGYERNINTNMASRVNRDGFD
jgi:hypothetical protein